jgi:transcriptional regulator with XRE-family HTH domain
VPSPLGAKIRQLRLQKGYSLAKLAELADTSNSHLWNIENRVKQRPTADRLFRIAAVLDVTTEYLMDDRQIEPDEQVADKVFFANIVN